MTTNRLLLTLLTTVLFSYVNPKPIQISLKNLMNNYKNSLAQQAIRYGDCIQLSLNSSKKANILQGLNSTQEKNLEINTKASELSWWIIKEPHKSLNESRGKKVIATSPIELIHLVSGKKLSYKNESPLLEQNNTNKEESIWSIIPSRRERNMPIKVKSAFSLKNIASKKYLGLNEKNQKLTIFNKASNETRITITDAFFMHSINEEVDKVTLLVHKKAPTGLSVNESNLTLENKRTLPLTPFTILREEEAIGLQYRLQDEEDNRRMVQVSNKYIHLKNNHFKNSDHAHWLVIPVSDKTAQSGRFRLKNKKTGEYIGDPEQNVSELSLTHQESNGLIFSFTQATLEESEEATIITYGSTVKFSLQSGEKKYPIIHSNNHGLFAEKNIEASSWKILPPNTIARNLQKKGMPIRAGDLIRLQEIVSGQFLKGVFKPTKQAIRFKHVALQMTNESESSNTHFLLSMPQQHKVLAKRAERLFYLTHAATDSQIYFASEDKKSHSLKAKLSVTRNDEDVPTNIAIEQVVELHTLQK